MISIPLGVHRGFKSNDCTIASNAPGGHANLNGNAFERRYRTPLARFHFLHTREKQFVNLLKNVLRYCGRSCEIIDSAEE
jgi:hypothetical protein